MDWTTLWIACWLPYFALAFTWVDDHSDPGYNCLGKVVDAICCKDSFCQAPTETECKDGNKQFLCSWTGSKCISFRDDKNNVCCKSGTADACAKIVQGICPDNWQVPNGCCSPEASKYNGTLLGVKPGHVCCNAPCSEMTKSGCPLPDTCAPKARAYIQSGNVNYNLGFFQSPQKYAQGVYTGKVIDGFGAGFRGDYAKSVLDGFGFGNSKDSQVDEITVDDLFNLLIDSLADDKDAMVYNSEMTSDPFLGKAKSGGSIASMNLPNPNIFLDRIYGSPFGLSQGQMGNYPSLGSPYDSSYGMISGYPSYGYTGLQGYGSQYQPMMPQVPYQPQLQYGQGLAQYGYAPATQYPGQTSPYATQASYAPQPQYPPQQPQMQYPAQQPQKQYPPQQPQMQYPAQQPQMQYPPQQPQMQYPAQQPQTQYPTQQPQKQYPPQQPQPQYPAQQPQPQYPPQQPQPQYPLQQQQPQYPPQQAQPQPQYPPQQPQPQPQYPPQQQQPQPQYPPQQPQIIPQPAAAPTPQVPATSPASPQAASTGQQPPSPSKPPQTQPPAQQPGPIYSKP